MTDTRNNQQNRGARASDGTTRGSRPGAAPGRSSTEWSTSAGARRARRRLPPISELLADLRDDVTRLVQAEIALFKAEMTKKATSLGVGAGLLVGALVLAFFAFGTLIAAGVLGLATVLPAWLSALIVGLALILIAVILALVGLRKLKQGAKPKPERSIEALTGGGDDRSQAHTDDTHRSDHADTSHDQPAQHDRKAADDRH